MSNKESIRQEIDRLKVESQKFLNDDKIPSETRFFIQSMLSMMDIIVSVLLIKKIRKNSGNSSIPPSQDHGSSGNGSKVSGDGEQVNRGSQLPNSRNISEEIVLPVEECKSCGSDLSGQKADNSETRIEIDIIYEVIEKKITAEIKECESCGGVTKAQFPEGVDGPLQYGKGIRSAIINYLVVQMLSYERCAEHFKGLLGKLISQATMLKYVFNFYIVLAGWEARKIKELLKMPVIHVDETSIRVNGKNCWLHTYSFGFITLEFVHEKRGVEAMRDIGILPKYGGVVIHDCWGPYFAFPGLKHGLCGAHILRELQYLIESEGHWWAWMMRELLRDAAVAVANRPRGILSGNELKTLKKRYREILRLAADELSPFPQKKKGKRGKVKHTDAQNLYIRLKKHEKAVLLFAQVKEVDFTNNRAERDIRCSKTKQKVSGGFRTMKYAQAYARITSFVKSMRYQGYSSLEAINLAMVGKNLP